MTHDQFPQQGQLAMEKMPSSGHHHHLVCRNCGFTVEVEGPTVEQWSQTIAEDNGFTEVSHTVEIFGTCRDCAAG